MKESEKKPKPNSPVNLPKTKLAPHQQVTRQSVKTMKSQGGRGR